MEIRSTTHGVGILSLPGEICILLGERLDVKSLGCLVRVCRGLGDVFTPILYAKWYSEFSLDGPDLPKFPPLPSNISLAKELEVMIDGEFHDLDEDGFPRDPYDEGVQAYLEERLVRFRRGHTDYISRMVELASSIQTLKWTDYFNNPTIFNTFTDEGFRRSLQACTKLRNVRIALTTDCRITLRQFKNLTSLELYRFEYVTAQVEAIAKLLSRCPHLKVLVLGIASWTTPWSLPHHTKIGFIQDSKNTLEHLCDYYHTACEAKPLQLSRLDLPAGLSPVKSRFGRNDNYLEKLTNTSFLTDLGFYNGLIAEDMGSRPVHYCDIDYSLLRNVGSLCSLKVTYLNSTLRTWLDDGVRNSTDLRHLRVTQVYSMYDPLLKEFDSLNLPRLSTLLTREVSNVPNTPDLRERVLEKLPGYDALSPYTVLDRLPGHGVSLTKLSLYLDFTTQWDQFSIHLSNMKFLRYLCIGGLRSDIDGLVTLGYVKLMSELCPSLWYVKIGYRAWNVGTGSHKSLRELGEREQRDDEFLAEDLWWLGY